MKNTSTQRHHCVKFIMKISLPLILAFCLCQMVFARTGFGQEALSKKITINVTNGEFKSVLRLISRKANVKFSYVSSVIVDRKVSISATDEPLWKILEKIAHQAEVNYTVSGQYIILSKEARQELKPEEASAPQPQPDGAGSDAILIDQAIKGKVTSQTGEPLPGVTVAVKGTQIGTVSQEDGSYQIILPDHITRLSFSMVGFVEQEVEIHGSKRLDVILKDKVDDLDEVVVVGFGTQRKASVVGAITSISPGKLKLGTSRSVSNNLAGQLAGVIGVQRSGEPGYDNSSFWIRGISTFGGNRSPLILVDGVERSLNNIDPEEIESFSILKDAAASAVYGVRGANGVILVNTKRGKVGTPKVSLRHEQAITQPVKLPAFIGAARYLEIMNGIRAENGEPEVYSKEIIDAYRNQTDPDLYPDVNWLDAISQKHASNMRTNMTVSGGSNILRYALVASYYGESGIIARDKTQTWDSSIKLKRYNIRSNVDVDLSPTTLLRFNIGGYLQDRNVPPTSIDNLFQQAFITPPFVHPIRFSSGEIPKVPERENPWALATQQGYQRT